MTLKRFITAVLPRLDELNRIHQAYITASVDYYHDPTVKRAMTAAELAQEYNDAKYWWQIPLRVAIWTRI